MTAPPHVSNSLVDFVPLIRSPATWLPRPISLPADIHPLPDDITAYFVYPYILENHVLSPAAPHKSHADRIAALRDEHSQRIAFLKAREDDKIRKRREQLHKLAPGYNPPDLEETADERTGETAGPAKRASGILEPTRKVAPIDKPPLPMAQVQNPVSQAATPPQKDVMDDLVEGLAKMDQTDD